MSTALRDMMSLIAAKYSSVMHEVDLVGHSIHDEELQLLVMDCPFGYVARLRHLDNLSLPSSDQDFCARTVPLLEVAITVKIILETTLCHISNSQTPLRQTSLVRPVAFSSSFIPVKETKNTNN